MKFKRLVVLDKVVMTRDQEKKIRSLANKVEIYNDIPKEKKEITKRIDSTDAIITSWVDIDKEILDSAKELKYIGLWSTGYGWVDIKYANQKGITICNVPDYATESVAELLFGQLLALLRHTRDADAHVRQGKYNFEKFLGEELKNKTVGIIGLGRIGKRVAEMAKAFKMNVVYFSRTRKPDLESKEVKFVDLETLIRTSDIVTLHTDVKKLWIGKKEMSMMKDDAIIANLQVDGVVDENALLENFKKGRLNAILDCLKDKNICSEFDEFRDRVILSPHIGFYTKQALNNLTQICIENAKNYLEGRVQNKVIL